MDTNEDKLFVPIRACSWQSSAPISRIIFRALFKPLIQMLGNECVVVLLGVCLADAIKLSRLAGGQAFLWIETRDIFQKPLPPQHLVNAADAAAKTIGGVEEGGVGVGHRGVARQPAGLNLRR